MTMSLGLEALAPWRADAPAARAVPAAQVNVLVRCTLLLFVMSIPFELPRRNVVPVEIPTLFLVLFLASTLTNLRACYRRIPMPLIWFTLSVWVLAISAVVNGVQHTDQVIKHFINLALMLAFLWAMSNVLTDARAVRLMILGYIAAITVRAGMQVLNIGVSRIAVWTGGERIAVLGQNTNWSAIILSAGLVLVVGLLAAPGKWLPRFPFLTWPLAALLGWATIQTGSRGGLLCVAAGLVVFLFSGRTPAIRIRNVVIGLLAIAGIGLAALKSPMMANRLRQSATEGNLAGRERIYPAVASMVTERPILGWGPVENQYEIGRRINERVRPSRDAHNLIGELLSASGMLGADRRAHV